MTEKAKLIERARAFCKSKEVSPVDANFYAEFAEAESSRLREIVEKATRIDFPGQNTCIERRGDTFTAWREIDSAFGYDLEKGFPSVEAAYNWITEGK